jgi:NADPH:quinone reductase-like Zn-dependent oxidoreductase
MVVAKSVVQGTHTTLDIVRSLGPDEIIDYTNEDFTRRSQRYDAIFEVAANRSLSDLRRVLTPTGILVLAGADRRGGTAIFARILSAFVRSRVLKQRVVFFVADPNLADLVILKELIEAGKVSPAIDRTYPLSEGVEAVRYLGTGPGRRSSSRSTDNGVCRVFCAQRHWDRIRSREWARACCGLAA